MKMQKIALMGSLALFTLGIFTSCSFKDQVAETKEEPQNKKKKNSSQKLVIKPPKAILTNIKWGKSGESEIKAYSYNTRLIEYNEPNTYNVIKPITLPSLIPNEISFIIPMDKMINPDLLTFLKAYAFLGGARFELITNNLILNNDDTNTKIKVDIGGLRNIFSDHVETTAKIKLDLFEEANNLLFSTTFILRSPPSKIEINEVHENNFNPEYFNLSGQLKLIETNEKAALFRAIEIKNNSENRLIIEAPASNVGEINANFHSLTHEDTGCEGKGYKLHPKSWVEKYAKQIVLVPLTFNYLTSFNLVTSVNPPAENFTITIYPNESIILGLYGTGEKALNLIKNGYERQHLTNDRIWKKCENICVEPGGDNCRYSTSTGEWICGDGGCKRWETRRKPGRWWIGTENSPVKLTINPNKSNLFIRYDDLTESQDPEGRAIEFISLTSNQYE